MNTVWKLIEDLRNKEAISEIIINGPESIFVERMGKFIQLNAQVEKGDIYSFAEDVAKENNRVFDHNHPILDGVLQDGSRVNVISEPYCKSSPAVTIRKYLKLSKHFDDDVSLFGLGEHWVTFLKACVMARSNIIVCGGTGVGKTTFLNLLLAQVPASERIVTIEDTVELSVKRPNVVRLESYEEMSMGRLVKNALRMRPDRIIVGETRGPELFDLLQGMNTGHDGSMSSLHASSAGECLSRMENLFMMAGFEMPIQVVRKQIASGVDFIIELGRNRAGQRVVSNIMEISGMEGANILTSILATREEEKLVSTGVAAKRLEKLHRLGDLPMDFFSQ